MEIAGITYAYWRTLYTGVPAYKAVNVKLTSLHVGNNFHHIDSEKSNEKVTLV